MKIKRLVIENFKSIERIELLEPNPFTVFVGPNGSGKSNIFEALEFVILRQLFASFSTLKSLFGGENTFVRRQAEGEKVSIIIETPNEQITLDSGIIEDVVEKKIISVSSISQLLNYTRLFVGKEHLAKLNFTDDDRLSMSANNMETVLKRLLADEILKGEIHEWLSLFIPGFQKVEVISGSLDSKDTLLIYEQGIEKPFTKEFISDGTYNIIVLLTAVYQSNDEPQFLCIEEPENGLHPEVLMTLVEFFRKQCEEKGHYIWLNTHSESLVRQLNTDEIILVDKRKGATNTRQIKGRNIYNIPTDQAWLTGALGGGLPW